MASKLEKYFFALGKATKAVKESARERRAGEAAPEPQPTQEKAGPPITLVRCPKCGAYADPSQPHACEKA